MTTTVTVEVQNLLPWSDPQTVKTRNGPRSVRRAAATPAFWAAWRADKEGLKAAGVSAKPGDGGAWEAIWWGDAPAAVEVYPTGSERAGERFDPDDDEFNESRNNEPVMMVQSRSKISPAVDIDRTAEAANVAALPAAGASTSGMRWSDEQQAIFAHFKSGAGNLTVEALAGTGKTTTVKEAFNHAPEQSMLYAVFNKKNQREAVAKITDPRVDVKTLHSLGYSYILSVWRGSKPDSDVERARVEAASLNIPDEAATAVCRLVGFAKNLFDRMPSEHELNQTAIERGVFCAIQDADGNDEWPVLRLSAVALDAMKAALVKDVAGRISFDDMVWLPVAANWVRPRYDLVCIDECQDMSLPQLMMALKAVRKGGRVVVVGDSHQAIYGFRGAAQDGMGRTTRALNGRVLPLTTTYRCPKKVVAMAQAHVPAYKAAPEAPEGEVAYCDEGELLNRLAVGDAVLSRLNAPLMPLCLALLRKGVSARIEGRDIGRQLAGMVRKLKAKSVPDFLRRLHAWADKQKSRLNVGKAGPSKCAVVDDQVETLAAVAEGCANVAEVEARLGSLFQDSDENAKPAVVLSSVHKAKGLEWERTALLSWTFNRGRKNQTPEQRQEEANIYYVALTRTKRSLTLVAEGGRQNTVAPQADGTKAGAA